MKRARSYSGVTKEALEVLGKLVRARRLERAMTAEELSERVGITRKTLRNIENGEAGTEIGTVFEVAALVGVRLFGMDDRELSMHKARLDEKLALLPKMVRPSHQDVKDDF